MIQGLPEKLAILREKYKMSQREVANRLKISPSVVSGYETGERTPSVEVLLALCNLYNCSSDYLLGREQKKAESFLNVSGLSKDQVSALQTLIFAIKNEF